VRKFVKMRDQC